MLSRIIRRSTPALNVCTLCNKSIYGAQHNLSRLTLPLVPPNRKGIGTCCSLLCSQQSNPKEKPTDLAIRKSDDKIFKKQYENKIVEKYEKKRASKEDTQEKREEPPEDRQGYGKDEIELLGIENNLHHFARIAEKNKDTYLETIRIYKNSPGRKRERVAFVYAALKYMEEFGVEKDLEVYKALIDVFPKEKMVPTNLFQTMYVHYPREQYCVTALLEQVENNGVIPDSETELLLLSIFGRHGQPLEKFWKMMYWMPKFRNLNPWPVPKPIPNDVLELAKLAMVKISSVDVESSVTVMDTRDVKDSIDQTFIVSAMAPKQRELLVQHDNKIPIYVEGPFHIYVATKLVDYFTLRANPPKNRQYPPWEPDGKES